MLYVLGVVLIQVQPFNIDKVRLKQSSDFVAKPVMGVEPPLEYVGEGSPVWRMSGTLFPKTLGGLLSLEVLDAMRETGSPQFLMRGDGKPHGWVVIDTVSASHSHLASDGVGRKVEVSITLRGTGSPDSRNIFGLIQGLFS